MGIKGFYTDDDSLPLSRKPVCNKCKLKKGCITPIMAPHGNFKKSILVWGESPEEGDDKKGKQFRGKSGKLLKTTFKKFGVELDEDCRLTNAIDCKLPWSRKPPVPTDAEIQLCYPRKEHILQTDKPKVIILLGPSAVKSFYKGNPERSFANLPLASLRGKIIPDQKLQAFICHSNHPSFILGGNEDKIHVFEKDIKDALKCADVTFPKFNFEENIKTVTNYKTVMKIFGDLREVPFTFDYETSSYRYHEKIHKIYMVSIAPIENGKYVNNKYVYCIPLQKTNEKGKMYWLPFQYDEIVKVWKDIMRKGLYVAQNIAHEKDATSWTYNVSADGFIWDTMLGCRVMDEERAVNGLKFQTFRNWGVYNYGKPVDGYLKASTGKMNRFDELDLHKASTYCGKDSYFTRRLYNKQKKTINANGMRSAYNMLHHGALALQDVKYEGIRIDLDKLREFKEEWTELFEDSKEIVLLSKWATKYKIHTGKSLKFEKQTSGKDLQILLYDIMKLKPKTKTKTGYSVAEPVLREYAKESPFIRAELKARKYLKMLSVLENFNRHQVDGFLHPSFPLHIARTYRSSSVEPNFQNIPAHDEVMRIIRKIIVARVGNEIGEVDYGSMEVRILGCWSQDPKLLEFINTDSDMHSYWTDQILEIKASETEKKLFKDLRFGVKGAFIFALFYGSYWKSVARGLWDHFESINYELDMGYGEWEEWIKECEKKFWKMFQGVRDKQMAAVEEYQRLGYLQQIGWGFRRHGYLSRNKIFNTHIQGPAFMCLLWSLIEANIIRKKMGWKSKLVGQIHDSMLWDMDPEEKPMIVEVVNNIMLDKIREENPWIIVPLETEWEFGQNWYDMEKYISN